LSDEELAILKKNAESLDPIFSYRLVSVSISNYKKGEIMEKNSSIGMV